MRHKTILASILLFSISFVTVAQDTGDLPPPMPPPPPGLPVDGVYFVCAFILLAFFYGSKKIMRAEQQ